MKKAILLFALLSSIFTSNAQTLPFFDDFEAATAFQVPSGYTGDVTVYLIHGVNRGKGLAAFMNTFNLKDSITTPLIGPIDAFSTLLFDWRAMDVLLYPSQTVSFVPGDKFEVSISGDGGVSYQNVVLVDASSYNPDTAFQTLSIPLLGFNGQNINVKFSVNRASGNPQEFFVDIDNIFVFSTSTGLTSLSAAGIKLFPTVANESITLTSKSPLNGRYDLLNSNGAVVAKGTLTNTIESTFDISSLPSGSYFFRLNGANKLITQFIKN